MPFLKSILAFVFYALLLSTVSCRQENSAMGPFEGLSQEGELDATFGETSLVSQKGDAEGIFGGDSLLASHFEMYPEDNCNGNPSYRRALALTNQGFFEADKVCGEDISLAFKPLEEPPKIYGYARHLALYKDRIYETADIIVGKAPDEEDEFFPYQHRYLKYWCVNNEIAAVGNLASDERITLGSVAPTYGISVEIRKSATELVASFRYSESTFFSAIGLTTSALNFRHVPPFSVTEKKLTDGHAYYAPGFILKFKPPSTSLKISVDGVTTEFPVECRARP